MTKITDSASSREMTLGTKAGRLIVGAHVIPRFERLALT